MIIILTIMLFSLYVSLWRFSLFVNLATLSQYYLLQTFKMYVFASQYTCITNVVRKMADDKALQFTFQHVIASIFLRKYCSFEMIDIILLRRKACRFRPIASVFHLTADILHIGTQVSNGWLFYITGTKRQFLAILT